VEEALIEMGRRLRAYRKLKQFTQEELARKLQVSVAVIGGIERGRRAIPQELLPALEQVLDVRSDLLINGESMLDD